MRRRRLLAAIATVASAGCQGRPDGPTVTPAAVPEPSTRTAMPAPACPELPSHAEVYVCSRNAGEAGTRLVLAEEGPEPRFRLRNRSGVAFTTADGWWTVARHDDGGWGIVAQGEGGQRRTVEPGEALAWTLSVGGDAAGDRRVALALGEGRYAFAVSGYVRGGELTGLVAPFAVRGGR